MSVDPIISVNNLLHSCFYSRTESRKLKGAIPQPALRKICILKRSVLV